jgi:hypothetical protein
VETSLGLGNDLSQVSSPRFCLVVDSLFLDGYEGLDELSGEWKLPLRLGLRLLNIEKRGTRTGARRGWAGPNGPTGLGPSGLDFGPIRPTVYLLHFGLLSPSIVGFVCRYLRDKGVGS